MIYDRDRLRLLIVEELDRQGETLLSDDAVDIDAAVTIATAALDRYESGDIPNPVYRRRVKEGR